MIPVPIFAYCNGLVDPMNDIHHPPVLLEPELVDTVKKRSLIQWDRTDLERALHRLLPNPGALEWTCTRHSCS